MSLSQIPILFPIPSLFPILLFPSFLCPIQNLDPMNSSRVLHNHNEIPCDSSWALQYVMSIMMLRITMRYLENILKL